MLPPLYLETSGIGFITTSVWSYDTNQYGIFVFLIIDHPDRPYPCHCRTVRHPHRDVPGRMGTSMDGEDPAPPCGEYPSLGFLR